MFTKQDRTKLSLSIIKYRKHETSSNIFYVQQSSLFKKVTETERMTI